MPLARAMGMGSTVACAAHSKSVCFFDSAIISSPVIVIKAPAAGPHPRRELTLMPRFGFTCPQPGMAAGAIKTLGAPRRYVRPAACGLALSFILLLLHVLSPVGREGRQRQREDLVDGRHEMHGQILAQLGRQILVDVLRVLPGENDLPDARPPRRQDLFLDAADRKNAP